VLATPFLGWRVGRVVIMLKDPGDWWKPSVSNGRGQWMLFGKYIFMEVMDLEASDKSTV
jgi:hypothetical protein